MLQSKRYLSAVEACAVLRKAALAPQVKKEFSTRTVVKHKVQLVRGLKRVVKANNERVHNAAKHIALCSSVLHLLQDEAISKRWRELDEDTQNASRARYPTYLFAANNVALVQHLHGVDAAAVFLADLHDLAK